MITEDYVSYKVARLLQERGFDWKCNTAKFYPEPRYDQESPDGIYAPTLQMVMKWLREVHHLHITIYSCSQESWMYRITKPHQKLEDGEYGEDFNTYEDAAEAAIKYCLEKLI